jgi:hypothetical protein
MASTSSPASTMPAKMDTSEGSRIFSVTPGHSTASKPAAAIPAPATPPIRAWLELLGRPSAQVIRFHTIAPTTAASTTLMVTTSVSTTPLPTVVATLMEMNAPATLSTPAISTAARGVMARVETVVAIAFAASWKPLVKSKNSASAMTAISVTSTAYSPHGRTPP